MVQLLLFGVWYRFLGCLCSENFSASVECGGEGIWTLEVNVTCMASPPGRSPRIDLVMPMLE